ncbi:hypothetical protein K474DRAFT_1664980 [Panus rudis PR-1116 ss-1]|nr:hypothetical protein K474DRAFT_1664980 [Panus rudis PR-1116 ss-1]
MVIDKSLPDDLADTPPEAPPSYDSTVRQTPRGTYASGAGQTWESYRSLPPVPPDSASPTSKFVPSPSPTGAGDLSSLLPGLSDAKGKGKLSSWLRFGQPTKTAKQVKSTVASIIYDLVNTQEDGVSYPVLDSCIEACKAHDVPFSELLQETSLEGHSLMYWAIVKRPQQRKMEEPDLVAVLLSLAEPLSDSAVYDLQCACLDASDGELFQQLRRSPAFARLSGADRLLLGPSVPPDDVQVRNIEGEEGGFAVWIRIPIFQKRMRVAKSVNVEFFARGRIWQVRFMTTTKSELIGGKHFDKGKWLITLSLLDPSPPTWVDSRMIINNLIPVPPPGTLSTYPLAQQPKAKKNSPSVEVRLKTGNGTLTPKANSWDANSVICVALDETPVGNNLQYDGSSYIASDGSLSVRIEAKLTKTDSDDCVIC